MPFDTAEGAVIVEQTAGSEGVGEISPLSLTMLCLPGPLLETLKSPIVLKTKGMGGYQ